MNGQTETLERPAASPSAKPKAAANGNKLSNPERKMLRKHESVIRHHFETFKPAGEALRDIRDKRLYRETHATFEDYCREKWEMSKTQANRLIAAATVVENIARVAPASITDRLTESVIRPLTNLPPDKQREAFKQAVQAAPATRGLTAKVVNAAAHKVSPKSFQRPAPRNDGKSDLIRRSELLDELNAWEKDSRKSGKFDRLEPREVVRAVRQIIQKI